MRDFEMDMTMNVDIDEVSRFAHEDLPGLLIHNTDFDVAAFVLQTVLDKLDEIKGAKNENEEE